MIFHENRLRADHSHEISAAVVIGALSVKESITHQGSHRPGKVLEFDLGPGKLLEFEKSAFVLEF